MTPVSLEMLVGYLGMGVLFVVTLYGLYSIRESAIRARREEAEDLAIEELRDELKERGVALFEIPDSSAGGEERR